MMKKNLFTRLLLCAIIMIGFSSVVYAEDYSDYSNECIHFGLGLRKDHKKPGAEKPSGVVLSDYDTYFYDKTAYKNDDKVMYLTFDCGYENGNTPKILDILAENDVKAIFFVTKPFIDENPDLVKRMKEEGHLVGNHTTTHPSLPGYSDSKFKKELNKCKKAMKKKTGYDMDPFMRPPMGHYSVRTMKMAQDMGYNTMLWSLALYDYEEKDQPGADYVVDMFEKHHFCGMMPLLHAISTSDTEALPEIISSMEDEGYRFGMVTDFIPVETKDEDDKAEEDTTELDGSSKKSTDKDSVKEENADKNSTKEDSTEKDNTTKDDSK